MPTTAGALIRNFLVSFDKVVVLTLFSEGQLVLCSIEYVDVYYVGFLIGDLLGMSADFCYLLHGQRNFEKRLSCSQLHAGVVGKPRVIAVFYPEWSKLYDGHGTVCRYVLSLCPPKA